jgi:hypothetical protein
VWSGELFKELSPYTVSKCGTKQYRILFTITLHVTGTQNCRFRIFMVPFLFHLTWVSSSRVTFTFSPSTRNTVIITPNRSRLPPSKTLGNVKLFLFLTRHNTMKSYGRVEIYEGVPKIFRTRRLKRELQMVQLFATKCNCIAILWVSLVSFAATTLCVASQRVFIIVVCFVIDSVRKFLIWWWVVSFTPRPLYASNKRHLYPLGMRLDGTQSRSRCGGDEKIPFPCRESSPAPSARSLVTILTVWDI